VIGVFLSFVLYVPRAAQVQLIQLVQTPDQRLRERLPGDLPCDRLMICTLEGELSFGAEPDLARHFAEIEQGAQGKVRVVLLVLKRARNPDAAFLHLLQEFHQLLHHRNVVLLLCGVQPNLGKALGDTGLEARIGSGAIFRERPGQGASILQALNHAYRLLGDGKCDTCPRRAGVPAADEPSDYVI
jgi:SulP family sulfate permease